MKKKYKSLCISSKTISTAIFEYLEKRGKKPNRKKGVNMYGYGYYGVWVDVEVSSRGNVNEN